MDERKRPNPELADAGVPPDLAATLAWLTDDSREPYGAGPIPDPTDGRLDALVDALLAAPVLLVPLVVETIAPANERPAWTLASYAERAASRAVRRRDPADLRRALLAVALAFNSTRDFRDVIVTLPLPWHSAELLGVDPVALFEEVAALPTGKGARFLRSFPSRAESDRRIEAMGYREGSDADGFRYVRMSWSEMSDTR